MLGRRVAYFDLTGKLILTLEVAQAMRTGQLHPEVFKQLSELVDFSMKVRDIYAR